MLEILKFKAKEDISEDYLRSVGIVGFYYNAGDIKMVKLSYCPLAYGFSIENNFF